MGDSISLDYYMFLLSLGIPCEGFVTDENGVVYRSICEPVAVPPESLHVYNPPGVNYSWNTFTLLTKSTLYYFTQDNIPDAGDIERKIRNRAVLANPDGTTTVDFGNGDLMVLPTNNSEIKISVTKHSDSLGAPVVLIRAKNNSTGETREKTMTLKAAETVYGNGYPGWLNTKSLPDINLSPEIRTKEEADLLTVPRAISVAGFTASGLELAAGNTTYRLYRMRGEIFSPKLYRSGWHGGSRGKIKTQSAAKALKKIGRVFFWVGVYFEISDFANDKQSFEKAVVNTVFSAVALTGPVGLAIGIAYFGLDLLGVFDGFERNVELKVQTVPHDYYSPADNTGIFIPDIPDEFYFTPVDTMDLHRLLLDK